MPADTNQKDTATKAAEAIQAEWSVGTFSRFCDDPADFDSAETNEIADVIRRCYQETQTENTLSRLKSWLNANDAELRLRLGELTAQEIRTLRAVLKAIAGLPLT